MARRLAKLFWEMFRIALFVVGGGYAIIAVADDVFSRRLKWTKEGELVEGLSLFQMFPGIMAGHCAVYVGRKVAGVAGSAVALAAVVLPSLAIFLAVSIGYGALPLENPWLGAAFQGLRAALAGVIAAMVVRSWRKSVAGVYGYVAFAVGLAALLLGANPAAVLVVAMCAGLARAYAGGVAGEDARSPRGGDSASACETLGRARPSRAFCSIGVVVPLFLKYGALAFGGGYVLVPMYIRDFVGAGAAHLQLPVEEFANLMALTQMTPGPIGINAATFFGYRLGGVAGAALATASLVLPGALLLSLALASLERFSGSRAVKGLLDGVRPVTISLMTAAAWAFASMSLWRRGADGAVAPDFVAIALAAFAAVSVLRRLMGVMGTIFACAAVSLALFAIWPH